MGSEVAGNTVRGQPQPLLARWGDGVWAGGGRIVRGGKDGEGFASEAPEESSASSGS